MPAQPKKGTWFIYRGKGKNRRATRERVSADYQRRLERHGVSYGQYKRGEPVTAARGHKFTPEKKLDVAKATPEIRRKYHRYVGRREGTVDIFTTDGIKTFNRIQLSNGDERKIGGHWNKIGKAMSGDVEVATVNIPSFKGMKVGGYRGVPKMQLEYRTEEIEQAAAKGTLPDKPFTIGS
jgi:hypothetical protein